MSDLSPAALRDAFGGFATGVTVITTATGDGDHGMTANAFMSVSLDPPLISVSLARASRMIEHIRRSGHYVVNVLRHDMGPLALHFAGHHDPALRDVLQHFDGHPIVAGSVARYFANVETEVEAGDHVLILGRVTALHRDPAASPLLFCHGKFAQIAS